MYICDWSSDVCSSDLFPSRACPAWMDEAGCFSLCLGSVQLPIRLLEGFPLPTEELAGARDVPCSLVFELEGNATHKRYLFDFSSLYLSCCFFCLHILRWGVVCRFVDKASASASPGQVWWMPSASAAETCETSQTTIPSQWQSFPSSARLSLVVRVHACGHAVLFPPACFAFVKLLLQTTEREIII